MKTAGGGGIRLLSSSCKYNRRSLVVMISWSLLLRARSCGSASLLLQRFFADSLLLIDCGRRQGRSEHGALGTILCTHGLST